MDYRDAHGPLLLIAGSADHIITASLNKKNFRLYSRSGSITTFREFAGRTHFIIGQEGWEDVAGFIASWIEDPSQGNSGAWISR